MLSPVFFVFQVPYRNQAVTRLKQLAAPAQTFPTILRLRRPCSFKATKSERGNEPERRDFSCTTLTVLTLHVVLGTISDGECDRDG